MSLQLSTSVRNAILDQIETTIGTSPVMEFRTGSPPANCGTASSGTLIASLTLPSDWLANASSGSKAKSGTWSGTASASGTIGYFRILDSSDTTCHMQGTCTLTGSGGDLTLDAVAVTSGQTVTVSSFSIADGNS